MVFKEPSKKSNALVKQANLLSLAWEHLLTRLFDQQQAGTEFGERLIDEHPSA